MNVGIESGVPAKSGIAAKAGMVLVVGMHEERRFMKLILDG
jgi:hypothetical protein